MQLAAEASDRSDKAESAIRNHESGLTQREANVKEQNRDDRSREKNVRIRRGRAKLRVMISRECPRRLMYSSANNANTESTGRLHESILSSGDS